MHLETVASLAAALRERKVSSTELVRSYLERIQAAQERLNAFISVEADQALAAAAAACWPLAKPGR
jgi:aspartyl-tRNA(Asn)/glutamyl-tRNA(Gln) amidotransferase subunit A